MTKRPKPIDATTIAMALPASAARALGATIPAGAFASSIAPGDASAAASWGLIEATTAKRRYNPTPLGRDVWRALEKRKAVA
jgi:hypothetical protein